jgi:hypothetical protein
LALLCGMLACARKDPAGRLRVEPAALDLAHGRCATLRLDWSATRELDRLRGRPFVFVHLLDRPNSVVRTFDHPVPRVWQAGQSWSYALDICSSALVEPIPPGDYLLTAGLYEPGWGYRWPLETGSDEVAEREYRVGRVKVAAGARSPSLDLSGGWSALERTSDRQILGRRRLEGPASIRVGGAAEKGEVRIALSVVAGSVGVEGDCGGPARNLGPGYHWLGVSRSAGTSPCEIRLLPAGPPPGKASLEVLGFAPAIGSAAAGATSKAGTP